MKSINILSIVFLLFVLAGLETSSLYAQSSPDHTKKFGVGIMIGEPTGVTVKNWFNNRSAFDIGAAWSLTGRNESLHLHADYLQHSWFSENDGLAFYYGIGGRVIFSDNPTVGARIPFGLTFVFDNAPFDLFVEAAPIIDLVPDVEFAGNGAVGIRYYF